MATVARQESKICRTWLKIMVKPLIASLAEKGIDFETPSISSKLLAQKDMTQRWELIHCRTLQTEVKTKSAELLLTGELKEGKTLKIRCQK